LFDFKRDFLKLVLTNKKESDILTVLSRETVIKQSRFVEIHQPVSTRTDAIFV